MKKKNKSFIIITFFTSIAFCLTAIAIPSIFLISINKNNIETTPNIPNPDPEPIPKPEPVPPNPTPPPAPIVPIPPSENKQKASLLTINDKKSLEKYLIKNRINDVNSHFNNLNSSISLNDIWDKFNNILFKTIYKDEFINEVKKIIFNSKHLGNNTYSLTYIIELSNDYVFEDDKNTKELTLSFDYIQDIPPEVTPPDPDFKTFKEAFDNDPREKKDYNLTFPLLSKINSIGTEEKNKSLITNFINRYDKLNLLDFLVRQEWIYQLMSFVFSNFNDNIYDWQFYTEPFIYKKISLSFNLKKDLTISQWKNNIFGSNLNEMQFSKNDKISIVVSYKDFDPTGNWKPKVGDFVKNKEWYDNNGNKKIISNAPQISLQFVSLDFVVNNNDKLSLSENRLTTIPYTMFWDFIESDNTTFKRPSNSIDLDEYSFGLAPTLVKMGDSNNLKPDFFPLDFDVQYSELDIRFANSLIERSFKHFDYNWNYEHLSQLRYFVNYNFYALFDKSDTYRINNGNYLTYETQIKLNNNSTQGLYFKFIPEWVNKKFNYQKDDIVKIRIEKLDDGKYSLVDNPGFYYLGFDPTIISDPFKYDDFEIKNYLDEKRFPLTNLDNRKNATLSSQIGGGKVKLSVKVLRNNNEITVIDQSFVLRTVSLAMPITYCYYIKKITV